MKIFDGKSDGIEASDATGGRTKAYWEHTSFALWNRALSAEEIKALSAGCDISLFPAPSDGQQEE